MTREEKKTLVLTTLVCLLPIIAGIILYNKMPEQIATHWDFEGTPNDWSSKAVALFVLPGGLLLLNIFFPFLLRVDPKYSEIPKKIKALIYWIIPVVNLFASSATIAAGLGLEINIAFYGQILVGLIFVIIGNYLPKMSQSYTVGIKLPWTLESKENWNKTHRMAGFVWVVCGLLIMASVLLSVRGYILVALMFVMILVPTIYSYIIYKKN